MELMSVRFDQNDAFYYRPKFEEARCRQSEAVCRGKDHVVAHNMDEEDFGDSLWAENIGTDEEVLGSGMDMVVVVASDAYLGSEGVATFVACSVVGDSGDAYFGVTFDSYSGGFGTFSDGFGDGWPAAAGGTCLTYSHSGLLGNIVYNVAGDSNLR